MPGKKSKGNNTAGRKVVKPLGDMVKLMNLGETVYRCAQTGKTLPRNGMVVRYDDKYFVNRDAVRQYVAQQELKAA